MQVRSLRAVPCSVIIFGLILLALQIAWRAMQVAPSAYAEALTPPPSVIAAQFASFGEPITLAGLLALRLQAFDNQPGISIPFAALDYTRVSAWLGTLLALDPNSNYPLLMSSYLYAQVPDPAKQRLMLDFTYQQFLLNPARRWRYLAHAALIAKHGLHDLPLAFWRTWGNAKPRKLNSAHCWRLGALPIHKKSISLPSVTANWKIGRRNLGSPVEKSSLYRLRDSSYLRPTTYNLLR
jgi:hypothetical protein